MRSGSARFAAVFRWTSSTPRISCFPNVIPLQVVTTLSIVRHVDLYMRTRLRNSPITTCFTAPAPYMKTLKQSTGAGKCWWDLERIKSTAGRIAGFLSGDKEKRILDVGCANGGLLGCLKELGFANLHGIDPSRACVENTRKLGIDAFSASLFHLPDDLGIFDCVILSHVLEHVHDLQSALHIIRGLLKPQGLAYVEVPDASRYQHYLIAPFQEFNTEHINHFTLSSLHNLLAANGYHRRLSGKDEILSAPGKKYPIAFAFYEKSGISDPMEKDVNALYSIRSYIAGSQALLDQMEMKLSKLSAKEIIVWGVGQLAMKLLAETSLGSKNIVAFVDNNPVNWDKKIKDVPVISPLVLKGAKTSLPYHHRNNSPS